MENGSGEAYWRQALASRTVDARDDLRLVLEQKLAICATLEAIADCLPHRVDRLACLKVAADLVPTLRRIHRFEEEELFPSYAEGSLARAASVSRLCLEHVEDECFADEVTEVLLLIGRGGPIENPEALGFMLRGFFQTVRRHLAFEVEQVVPLARERQGSARTRLEADNEDARPAGRQTEILDADDPFAQDEHGE